MCSHFCRAIIHIGQRRKRERPENTSGIVKLRHQLRKELKSHEQYNLGHEISTIYAHLCSEVRYKACQRQYNKSRSYIYFWCARYDGFPAIPGAPVPTSS